MSDRQQEIREKFRRINILLDEICDLKSLTLKEKVAIAASIASLMERGSAVLSPLKDELRKFARYSGRERLVVKDDSGRKVEMRKSPLRYTLRKGLHFREVFSRLGDRVDDLFRVSMAPFPDFPERLESCSEEDKAYLAEIVLTKDDPIRVCFGRKNRK